MYYSCSCVTHPKNGTLVLNNTCAMAVGCLIMIMVRKGSKGETKPFHASQRKLVETVDV